MRQAPAGRRGERAIAAARAFGSQHAIRRIGRPDDGDVAKTLTEQVSEVGAVAPDEQVDALLEALDRRG